MSTAITLEHLSVGYRGRGATHAVLTGLDLAVEAGAFVCLLGANGTGKSTLLRTLARMQKPLAGRVLLSGVDIRTLPQAALARLVGLVLTERFDVAALDVYRVVALGRYAHQGWSGRMSDADHAAVRNALAAVGASHLAQRDCVELSDGERQRVNVARALAQEPAVLILDEPTAHLDAASRAELMALLQELARGHGLAVVASTHDIDLALRSADAIWLASAGRVLAGAPEDLVSDGSLGRALSTGSVGFVPETRSFRLWRPGGRIARVEGSGLPASLAAAVLERQGFEIVAGDAPILVEAGDDGAWALRSPEGEVSGRSWASLAAAVRSVARAPPP
ncbi:MAG: ABC transporter ATP-binding protein [Bauldia sp.]|nr:ABC transporter ATP-binding protein [Bauldia sp.]